MGTAKLVLAVASAIVMGLAALNAAVLDEKTVIVTDKDKDKEQKVELVKGDKLVVKLESNRTTGFSWTLTKSDEAKLKSKGKPEYEGPSKDKAIPDKAILGAGGTDVFEFTAAAAGEVSLEFQYKRSFEKDKEPAKTFKVKATIR